MTSGLDTLGLETLGSCRLHVASWPKSVGCNRWGGEPVTALKFNVMLANMGVPGYSGGGDPLRGAAALSPSPPSSYMTHNFDSFFSIKLVKKKWGLYLLSVRLYFFSFHKLRRTDDCRQEAALWLMENNLVKLTKNRKTFISLCVFLHMLPK